MELIIVLAIAIILGPQRLPDAARSLGSSVRNFKGALSADSAGDLPERTVDELTQIDTPATPLASVTAEKAATAGRREAPRRRARRRRALGRRSRRP
ncbi:MAG: twin-arginine translocase TatA/TatE family subunit [Solirubrobacterales bacterium]|nr:twin-arginine translocase TatA/TatE family subunit [Solirubrobacterales bacterium]